MMNQIKKLLKKYLERYFSGLYYYQQSYRFRLKCKSKYLTFQKSLHTKLYNNQQPYILSGPFQGMQYLNEIVWGPITPKWLGSYEEELHEIIDTIKEKSYSTVIDVGAAEGYYAVGLAKAIPSSRVISYDIDPFARKLQKKLCNANDVKNLTLKKHCSHHELEVNINGKTLLICDIEGGEIELLDQTICPQLAKIDILVELHSFHPHSLNEVKNMLISRFKATHHIESIVRRGRDKNKYQMITNNMLNTEMLTVAINESRGEQEWLWITSIN